MGQSAWTTVLKGFDKGRVILAEQRAELVGDVLPIPHSVLLCARKYGDRMGQLGVCWQGPMRCPVDAQNVRQQFGIHSVRLGAGNAMPIPVASTAAATGPDGLSMSWSSLSW